MGNITNEPALASLSHLSEVSPCRGRGVSNSGWGPDIDGESWADPPSIGCDEYWPGTATGELSVAIGAPYTTAAVGFDLDFTASIEGRTSGSRWDFGDGNAVNNRPCVSHDWSSTGVYAVTLTAFNASYPGGTQATVMVNIVAQPVHYVNKFNSGPVAPYST